MHDQEGHVGGRWRGEATHQVFHTALWRALTSRWSGLQEAVERLREALRLHGDLSSVVATGGPRALHIMCRALLGCDVRTQSTYKWALNIYGMTLRVKCLSMLSWQYGSVRDGPEDFKAAVGPPPRAVKYDAGQESVILTALWQVHGIVRLISPDALEEVAEGANVTVGCTL